MDCKAVISVFGFFTLAQICAAQPQLILVKGDKVVTSFYEADYIRFKRKDRDHFTIGFIAGMTPDYFRIGDDTTFIHQIERIDISERQKAGFQTHFIGSTLITAGIVLFLGDMINETVVNDNTYTTNAGVITASAVLIGSGVLMRFINNDIFVIGRRKRVTVIQH